MSTEIKIITLSLPLRVGKVNCYLVRTDASYILIDTGVSGKRADLEKELESAGCGPSNLKLIILTHGDFDHTGNCAYLREKFNTKVAMHHDDRGMASDSEARVYVLVHPLFTREIWVQNLPIVRPDGSWQVYCYFGTETLGIGDQYEIIALATKENFLVNLFTGNYLRTGQKLKKLPQKTNMSNVVTVIRPE